MMQNSLLFGKQTKLIFNLSDTFNSLWHLNFKLFADILVCMHIKPNLYVFTFQTGFLLAIIFAQRNFSFFQTQLVPNGCQLKAEKQN